jgi:hypothetical protein
LRAAHWIPSMAGLGEDYPSRFLNIPKALSKLSLSDLIPGRRSGNSHRLSQHVKVVTEKHTLGLTKSLKRERVLNSKGRWVDTKPINIDPPIRGTGTKTLIDHQAAPL